MPLQFIWLALWPTTASFNWLTAFIDVSGTQDLLFMFPINLRFFTAYLKTGKHIGSNLELSLNSVVESAKPDLDLNQQRSFEMLVWKKAFLDVSSLWEKKRKKSNFNDISQVQHIYLIFLVEWGESPVEDALLYIHI